MAGMFTGIIEHVAELRGCTHSGSDSVLEIDLGPLGPGTKVGDSVCVSGACLTVAALSRGVARFEVSAETRRKTTIPGWKPGRALNLERALSFGARLGGHLVSGHVDGVGRLHSRRAQGMSERFTVVLPADGSVQVVEKGSLALDGISLTCFDCRGSRLSIAIIPHTLSHTTLGTLRPGMLVNLEQDFISRWVEKLVRHD
jgi:riboflavin synthase